MFITVRWIRAPLFRILFVCCAYLSLAASLSTQARSQEIEPGQFTLLPAGVNVIALYHFYIHDTTFNFEHGPTFTNSKTEVNLETIDYTHFTKIAGQPFRLDVVQSFGSLSGASLAGQKVGSAYGALNPILSVSTWLYANPVKRTYVAANIFLGLPIGSYSSTLPINLGTNRWEGDAQLGITKGFNDRISIDASFDTQFVGDNVRDFPGNDRLSRTPALRGQVFANYQWFPGFTTSLGWEGFFNAREQVNGNFDGTSLDEQRIRGSAQLFISRTTGFLIELNRDITRTGGYKDQIGATARLLKLF